MIRLELKKSFNGWADMGDGVDFRLDYPTIEQEQKLQDILLKNDPGASFKYTQNYIRYTVKDWKGLVDSEGNSIPCVVKNGELEKEIWWALVKDPNQASEIYVKIHSELEFNATDKKKSQSAVNSGIKEN